MTAQTFVLCPHCGGTGTVTLMSGPADCIACSLVRVIPVHTLVAGSRTLARELGRARLRLAALEAQAQRVEPEPPPRRAGGSAVPMNPPKTPEEEKREEEEYRRWAAEHEKHDGA